MPSQFFGLQISASGLRTANAALNTTAHNISNVQTVGYTRQQAVQEANKALQVFATYGCAGAGVDTVAIERMRDVFYDMRFRENNATLGEYDVKNYYCDVIQQYLDDNAETGFGTVYNDFYATLQTVTTNASSTDAKAQFIAAANKMTEYFNNMAGNLQQLQKDVNEEIKIRVERINAIAVEIATLNQQINVIEMSGAAANDLRDKRDLMLDELSEIVDVEFEEVPITDLNDPERETGGYKFIVTIASGQVLVEGERYHELHVRSRDVDEKVNQTDADGLYDIFWENGNDFNMNNATMQGSLKGLIAMRDGNNNQAFYGRVTNVTRGGQGAEVEVTVDESYLFDLNKCNLSETGGSIMIANTLYYYDSWSFDPNTSKYTFVIDETKTDNTVTLSQLSKEVEIGTNIDYQGIPYYLNQMNEFIRAFSAKINEVFMSGYDREGNAGAMFFTARKPVAEDEIKASQYTIDDFTDTNGYYEMTAFNIEINQALLDNPDLLGTKSSPEVGIEEFGQVTELLEVLQDKDKFSFRNATAGEFLQSILSDVALNAGNAEAFYNTYHGIAVTIENQRMSISSVDEDEEAVNMVKFQNAYTLSSKMIQTLTEIYDRLILQTGV